MKTEEELKNIHGKTLSENRMAQTISDKDARYRLKKALIEQKKKEYPTLPDYAIGDPLKKYNGKKSSNKLRCQIKDFIKAVGGSAWDGKTQGQVRDNTKVVTDIIGRTKRIGSIQYIPSDKKGFGDICGLYEGKYFEVEVKIGYDRQRDSQVRREAELKEQGCVYEIVHSLEEFFWVWDNVIDK